MTGKDIDRIFDILDRLLYRAGMFVLAGVGVWHLVFGK
jgi:hypothetical protein